MAQRKNKGRRRQEIRKRNNLFISVWKMLKSMFLNRKIHQLVGFALLIAAAYMLIAFISFIFTWQVDQDKLSGSFTDLIIDPNIVVENWLGKLGAYLSHIFIHRWFGVSSFLFVLLSFITGFRILFKVNLLPLKRTFAYSFFFLIWISVLLAYFFNESSMLWLGGSFGYSINRWLNSALGSIGTIIFLFFSILSYVVVAFGIRFEWITGRIISLLSSEKREEAENKLVEFDPEQEPASDVELPTVEQIEKEIKLLDEEQENEEVTVVDLDPSAHSEDNANDNVKLDILEVSSEENPVSEKEINRAVEEYGEFDPTLELGNYQLPPVELLTDYGGGVINIDHNELEANKDRIVNTLGDYNISIQKIKATVGPTVTLYEIIPSRGTRISKIKNLEDDIALSLSALGIRIIAPIPGKGTIGIEVPNRKPEIVGMRSMITSEKFQTTDMELPIALGKTISNETYIADLTKMPHLLIAGATGQGKSVGLNGIIVSLLYKKHPAQVKIVMVDPKKVELTLFEKLERHFLAKLPDSSEAIITDNQQVVHTLKSLCIEMEQRLNMLNAAGVRNIKEYNQKFIKRKLNPNKNHHYMPYIVLIIDEFADLIMMCGKEVEGPITRLAQLARAIGIHLIIATQRPSTNIITGTIKANFPTRLAYRVISQIDSRTILDLSGAEQLIGKGDMLLSTGSELVRLQCAFVDTSEVERITDYIGNQKGYSDAYNLPEYVDENASNSIGQSGIDRDELFEEAAEMVVQHQQGSASLLQRRLKLGYNRAGRIIDQLEAAGIIGPFEGSKARKVLIGDLESLEQFLNSSKDNDLN